MFLTVIIFLVLLFLGVPVAFTMNNNFGFGGNNTSVVLGWQHD